MQPNIAFSAAASAYIKTMLEKQQGLGLRLTIKKTGCSGFSYAPSIVETANANDIAFQLENNVTIYVDPIWLHLLEGVTVDYVEEDKTGLKQKRLIFVNPNEASRCGCGESFHIE
jgi:iron-sulfur cluster assembly accessory protein